MTVARAARACEFLARLQETLSDKKRNHCVFAAEYLSSFAEDIGVDHDDAVAAVLLHDLCRDVPKSELLAMALNMGVPVSDIQRARPILLHGPVAAVICRNEFGLNDNVCEAICWHTTGCPGLGLLGQGLVLADFAEPTRKYPEAQEARDIFSRSGFSEAVLYVAQKKVEFGRAKDVFDPVTDAFYQWLKREQA